jgi:hypothetical protein
MTKKVQDVITKKMEDAIKQTPSYNFHRTADAVMKGIPEVVAEELSVEALATLMMTMHKHWHSAMAFAEAEACMEGCVWDAKRQKLRELAD